MKLAPKLTLLFLMIAITPLVIVGVSTYENSWQSIIRQTVNHLISTNIIKEAVLNRWIEDAKKDLQLLADRPYFKDSFAGIVQAHDAVDRKYLRVHQEIVEDRLAPLVKAGVFCEIFILRPGDGLVLISTDPSQESKYRETQPYFVEGKKDTYIQNVTYSQPLEQPVMTIATPVRDRQGKLIAVLCGRLDLGELTEIMEQGRGHNQTEDTYLVNKFNFFVTEPRFGKNFALKKTAHTQGVNAALRGTDGTGFYLDYRGVPVIGAYNWLPNRELCLITEMDQSEALAPIVRMGWVVVGIALAIAMAAAGMAFLSARTVTRPVKRLVEGTEEIGRGNLDHQVGTSAEDEIGELSRAFDRMTMDLKTTTVSRDELAREKIFSDSVMNSLPGVFYLFDKEGRFIRWNRNFEQVTEYSAEEISTMTPLDLFSREEQQLVANEIERTFIKGEAWVEAGLLTKNGRSIPFYLTGHRLKIGDNHLLAGVGIDISELKRKERELEDKNAELERFTYAISHDLKSPLVTIKTFLGYLEQDLSRADTERIAQDMSYMRTAADKMGRLLDELLEMSRIGRLANPPEHLLFGELVGEAQNAVAGPLAQRGVEVQVADEVIPLFGDRPRLVEIWQNLVENAVKFMGDQPNPRIEIGVERHGRDTVFFVRDNGMGIDPRYQAKVFGLFEKLDPRSEGTGLGLAITKRVVELHQGTIWLESGGPGRGVCFMFTLPGAMEDQGEGENS